MMARNPLIVKKVETSRMVTPERQSMGILDDFKTGKATMTKELYTQSIVMPTGAVNGYVLTCNNLGEGTWQEAPSYWWQISTTAEFNEGNKGSNAGNYVLETSTDNLKYSTGEIKLASRYSDVFNFADADGLTWKWENTQDIPFGTATCDIDTTSADKMYIGIWPDGVDSYSMQTLKGVKISGDFDIRVDFEQVKDDNYDMYPGLAVSVNSNMWTGQYLTICLTYENQPDPDGDAYYTAFDNVGLWDQTVTTDTSGKFRITRSTSGTNCTVVFYYWNAGTSAWVAAKTQVYNLNVDNWADEDMHIQLHHYVVNGSGTSYMNYSNFQVYSGTLITDSTAPYRTSGTYATKVFTMPYDSHIKDVKITLSGASATYYVSQVAITDTSDSNLSVSNTSITSNGENTVGGWSVDPTTIEQDVKVRFTLAGDGAGSCAVTDVKISFKK